jgi:hypothetical protein
LAITGLSVADVDADTGTISVTLSVAHGTLQVAAATGVVQSGTDSAKTLTGTLSNINAALAASNGVVYRGSAGFSGGDTLTMVTSDQAGSALSDTDTVAITVKLALSSTDLFALWQKADANVTEGDINALNAHSAGISTNRDTTSADGSANQTDAGKRLTQHINQVTGTDIVSDAEFDAGFTVTGKAAAGAGGTIKFRLDKDRTTGADGEGAQVLSLGANDVNGDGTTDVTATYDNATGDWSLAFAAGSAALLQATHNTAGSGVHQLLVDTDGNGARTGTGATAEASRLFLVASGTASNTDTGLVGQNFSVLDKLTSDAFVYFYGDPDGTGIGVWSSLDSGDSADGRPSQTDIDGRLGDLDFYKTAGTAVGTQATAGNTVLHLVTNIAAQTWEFHIADMDGAAVWTDANATATDHVVFGSNTSRLASLGEAMALYAANFGADTDNYETANYNIVGAIQPMSNTTSTNGSPHSENNNPYLAKVAGTDRWMVPAAVWTAAPMPAGHGTIDLFSGVVYDYDITQLTRVSAIL